MIDKDPKAINPQELGVAQEIEQCSVQVQLRSAPAVLYDQRGRIRWRLPGNSEEENELVGVRNVQALFLKAFPEFGAKFLSVSKDGVAEEMRKPAEIFIEEKIGTRKKFDAIIGKGAIHKIHAPYFSGSYRTTIDKSFGIWGITFKKSAKADSVTGLFFDGQYQWAPILHFTGAYCFDFMTIVSCLPGVETKDIRDRRGVSTMFYRVDQVDENLSVYTSRPKAQKGVNRYIDDTGIAYVSISATAFEQGLDHSTVTSLSKGCSFIKGRNSNGKRTLLYKESELVDKIKVFKARPREDKKNRVYTDSTGRNWSAISYFFNKYKEYGISKGQLVRYLSDTPRLDGRNSSGIPATLYSHEEATLVIEAKLRRVISFEDADEELGRLIS